MYFYAVTGKQKVKTVVETTDDEGEVILVTSVTEVDCKGMLTFALGSNRHGHGGFAG